MANAVGQRSSTNGSLDDLTDYLYVYMRADGRLITRCHPNAPPSTPEWSHQESDGTELEEQEGEYEMEKRTKESKSVLGGFKTHSQICSDAF